MSLRDLPAPVLRDLLQLSLVHFRRMTDFSAPGVLGLNTTRRRKFARVVRAIEAANAEALNPCPDCKLEAGMHLETCDLGQLLAEERAEVVS